MVSSVGDIKAPTLTHIDFLKSFWILCKRMCALFVQADSGKRGLMGCTTCVKTHFMYYYIFR